MCNPGTEPRLSALVTSISTLLIILLASSSLLEYTCVVAYYILLTFNLSLESHSSTLSFLPILGFLLLRRDNMSMATHININKYKGKYFTEVNFQFQSFSSLSSIRNMMPCRHTWCWRAESSTSQSTGSRRRDCVLDIVWAYEIPKSTPHSDLLQQGHTPIVSLTMNQAFKHISLWGPYLFKQPHFPILSPISGHQHSSLSFYEVNCFSSLQGGDITVLVFLCLPYAFEGL